MGDRIRNPIVVLGGAAFALLVLGSAGLPGDARAQTVIGGSGQPSVSVDMGVLDSLGPPPTVPSLLMPNGPRAAVPPVAPGGRIVLTPPGEETGRVHLHPPRGVKRLTRRAPVRHRARAKTAARPSAKPSHEMARRAPEPIAPPAMTAPPPPPPPMEATPAPKAPPAAPSVPAVTPPAMPTAPTPPPVASAAPPAAPEPPAPPPPPPSATAAPPPPPSSSPSPSQTASLGPSGSAGQVSLPFAVGSAALDSSAKAALDSIAARADKNSRLRLELLAYASGTGDMASRARRLSLSRALAVRSYLIDKGVRSTRIDVRALGDRVEGGGSADRVDVVVTQR